MRTDSSKQQAQPLRQRLLGKQAPRLDSDESAEAVRLLGDGDQRVQRAAGDALIRTGAAALPFVANALDNGEPAIRRASAYVLGELLRRAPDPSGNAILQRALNDPEPKVRKNAAIALGKLSDAESAAALKQQLQVEPNDYVRPSIVLALGQIGGEQAHGALRDFRPATPEDERALQLALERSDPQPLAPIRIDVPIEGVVDLLCREGIETILGQELVEAGIAYEKRGIGYVRVNWRGGLSELLRFRCFDAVALPVTAVPRNPLDAPRDVAAVFARSPALQLALQLTELKPSAKVRYRVTLELPPRTAVRPRAWIEQFSAALHEFDEVFSNAPGSYSWEFLVRHVRNTWYLGIRPSAYLDPRFSFRQADVPAALNPSVAAAMVRLLPTTADDIVVDPFCGSGAPLIERARHGPYRALVGIDHSSQALAAARTNVKVAGLERDVKLLQGDARDLSAALSRAAIKQVDAIITNPPYGVRVGSREGIAELYPAFLQSAAAVLKPSGHLVMLAKEERLALAAAREHGFEVRQKLRVDTGGILVSMLALQRI